MLSDNLKNLHQEYLLYYKENGIKLLPHELQKRIAYTAKIARENYKRLKHPITTSLENYIEICVHFSLSLDLATRSVETVNLTNPPFNFRAAAAYFLELPYELHQRIEKDLFNIHPEKREEFWKDLNLNIPKIEKKFIAMIEERKRFAQSKGYESQIDLSFKKSKIPQSVLNRFVVNQDKLINFCNQNLPKIGNKPDWFYSNFSKTCFLCMIQPFPFSSLESVFEKATFIHPILQKYNEKITIKPSGSSHTTYKEGTDSFEVYIENDQNLRHQIVDLVHELGHVINNLEDLNKNKNPFLKGRFLAEKEANEIEIDFYKKTSRLLYQASFGWILWLFRRTLFEIELHKNPRQNLSKLYADTYNKCFKGANQKSNPTYFIDTYISLRPFSTLPHTLAYSEVVTKLIEKKK